MNFYAIQHFMLFTLIIIIFDVINTPKDCCIVFSALCSTFWNAIRFRVSWC